jgi:hypothetical protein
MHFGSLNDEGGQCLTSATSAYSTVSTCNHGTCNEGMLESSATCKPHLAPVRPGSAAGHDVDWEGGRYPGQDHRAKCSKQHSCVATVCTDVTVLTMSACGSHGLEATDRTSSDRCAKHHTLLSERDALSAFQHVWVHYKGCHTLQACSTRRNTPYSLERSSQGQRVWQ